MWEKIAAFSRSGFGIIASLAGFALAIYYGPRKMLETWDWYIYRFFDEPVLDILREQSFLAKELRPPNFARQTFLTVGDLAKKLNRSHHSVGKSIKRLRRKNLIELYYGGFRLKE